MRVLVTGGAGFIGANLCRSLVVANGIDSVVVLDDVSTGLIANLRDLLGEGSGGGWGEGSGVVELHVGSILDTDALDAAIVGCDAVVHLAAIPSVQRSVEAPIRSHLANATGTIEVLEAARRHGGLHVITASSSSVYGANPTMPKHEQLPTRPLSPYAASKLAAEAYTLAYGHSYSMPTLAFRFFNVYGPLQRPGHAYAAAIPAFVYAALTDQPVTVHGTGEQSRDFTSVDTVAAVIVDSLRRRVHDPEPINLAFGTRSSLNEVIGQIAELTGKRPEVRRVESRVGDVMHSQADGSRLGELFPDIRPLDLATGLKSTIAWMADDVIGG